jgi:hypothetical protein
MFPIPSELAIGGVYLPPMLLASLLGLIAAGFTARWMNRRRLGRYLANPPLVFLAMIVIYTVAIGTLFVGI